LIRVAYKMIACRSLQGLNTQNASKSILFLTKNQRKVMKQFPGPDKS